MEPLFVRRYECKMIKWAWNSIANSMAYFNADSAFLEKSVGTSIVFPFMPLVFTCYYFVNFVIFRNHKFQIKVILGVKFIADNSHQMR